MAKDSSADSGSSAEIAIGQHVEVCPGRLDGDAGMLIKAGHNLNVKLNELDGCAGTVVGISGHGKALCAVVDIESRSAELCGKVALPREILKRTPKK